MVSYIRHSGNSKTVEVKNRSGFARIGGCGLQKGRVKEFLREIKLFCILTAGVDTGGLICQNP